MGASGSSTKKTPHAKKNDKLAFAESPGMYKNQNPPSAVRNTNQGKRTSIVLQRRYRDDSLAEESVSVYSIENKKPQQKAKEVVDTKVKKPNNSKPKKETPIVKAKPVDNEPIPIQQQQPKRNVVQRKLPIRNNYNDNVKPKRKVVQPDEIIRQPVYQRQQRNRVFNRGNNVPNGNDDDVTSDGDDDVKHRVERVNRVKDKDISYNVPYAHNNGDYNYNYTHTINNNNTCYKCGLTKYNNTSCNHNHNCQCHYHHNCTHHCNCNNHHHCNHNNTCNFHITTPNCFTISHTHNPLLPPHPLPDTNITIKHRKHHHHHHQPITDLSPLIEHDAYDAITFEYNKHKTYLSSSEKHKKIPLPQPSYSLLYHIAYRIHKSSIACFLSLTPHYDSIHYITSSTDNTIKLWDNNFHLISTIHTERAYSTCLIHYKSEYILSSEGIYIYGYHLRLPNKIKYIFRGHTDMILHLLYVDDDVFISAGKDTSIRMWKSNPEIVVRYYDGHYSAVRKVVKVYNERNYVSYGDDKKIIIWENEQSSAVNVMDVYYTCCDVVGTHFGFITGSYDNKIRLYSMREMNGEMFALFEMDWSYYSRCFVVGNYDESLYLFTNYRNEVVVMDAKEKEVVGLFRGPGKECKVNAVVKDYYWENSGDDDEGGFVKNFIAACDNGCVFVWSLECNEERGYGRERLPEIFNMLSEDDDGDKKGKEREVSLNGRSKGSEREVTVDESLVIRSMKGSAKEEKGSVKKEIKEEVVNREIKEKESGLHNEDGVKQNEEVKDEGKGSGSDKNEEKENEQDEEEEEEDDHEQNEEEEDEQNEKEEVKNDSKQHEQDKNKEEDEQEEEEEDEEEEEEEDDDDDEENQNGNSKTSKILSLKSLPQSSVNEQVKQEANQANVIQHEPN